MPSEASIDARLAGLFAKACHPNTPEEEARTCAVQLCRIAREHGRALFVPLPDDGSRASMLAPEEVIALVRHEREAGERRLRLMQANHAAELAQVNAARRHAEENFARMAHASNLPRQALGGRARVAALIDPPRPAPITLRSWDDVAQYLAGAPHGTQLQIPRMALPHPAYDGAERSIGLPRGQARDWRFGPDERGRGLHVHEHPQAWIAHLDAVHPARDLWGHIRRDVF